MEHAHNIHKIYLDEYVTNLIFAHISTLLPVLSYLIKPSS
jgi:hypothetical protein